MSTATMTDAELQRDVLDELEWEPSVDAAHIGVSVKDGVVTLTGHVSSYAEKYAAERAAKRVHGVKAVANEIDVKLPGSSRRTDEDIAEAAVSALKSHLSVPADRIKVTVRNGLVTLEGEVEWQYQKIAAENAVRYLAGVTGVSNLITVKPRVSPSELKSKIEDALKRSARWTPRITVGGGARSPSRQRAILGRRRRLRRRRSDSSAPSTRTERRLGECPGLSCFRSDPRAEHPRRGTVDEAVPDHRIGMA